MSFGLMGPFHWLFGVLAGKRRAHLIARETLAAVRPHGAVGLEGGL